MILTATNDNSRNLAIYTAHLFDNYGLHALASEIAALNNDQATGKAA